jgi:transglutaminase-like putative cysteine protease
MTLTDVRQPEPAPNRRQTESWSQAPQRAVKPQPRTAEPLLDPAIASELIATVGLMLFSIAVAAGYARVFAGWQFFDNFIALAVIGHGFGFVARRLRVPGIVAVPALGLLMIWVIGFVHYRESYTLMLPTGDTLELFRAEIELVREQFRTAVAPVIYGGGWDVLAAIGIALTVTLSDTFAFRAYARAEALVPGGVLFVFVAALGFDRSRVALSGVLVAAGVAATVALRAHHSPRKLAAIGARRSPARLVLPAACATAAIVAVTASFVGPRIPGAGAEPIYETRGGNGGSVTNVVSPLVDIRSRLTNRSNQELFSVQADFESYWRLSALPRFDGTTWGLPERSLSRVDGELSSARDGAAELRQTITISALGEKFVPTAADPVAASPQGGLRWNSDSSTLLKTDGDLAPGDTFEIVSASPRFDVDALAAASSTDPGDPIYLELPDGFPSSVGDLARDVTAGASSPFVAARTLQDWFRSEFDYSLQVQAGHNNNAIEGFLRDRVGYCEQFAGTYAAMMRALGIPARVAVGFTPGNFDGTSYSVLGKNAHAWPEVWFDGLGWVAFEPTPGRGAPGAENYTDVAPQQDSSGVDPDAPVGEPGSAAEPDRGLTPQTSAPAPERSNGNASNIPIEDQLVETTGGTATAGPDDRSVPWTPLIALALVGLAVALPALIRRWRRRRSPNDAAEAVAMIWRRSLADAAEVGVRTKASLTPEEHADAVAIAFPVLSRPFHSLASTLTEVTFSPTGGAMLATRSAHGPTRLDECRQWGRQIERAVADSITPAARVRRYFTRLS